MPNAPRARSQNVCPNCGGGFVARPIRPRGEWRAGTGLAHDPPGTRRRSLRYSEAEIGELVERLAGVDPRER